MMRAVRFVLFHQPVHSRSRPRQRAARRPSAGGTALGTNRAPLKNALFAIPSAAPLAAAPDLKRTPCPLAFLLIVRPKNAGLDEINADQEGGESSGTNDT